MTHVRLKPHVVVSLSLCLCMCVCVMALSINLQHTYIHKQSAFYHIEYSVAVRCDVIRYNSFAGLCADCQPFNHIRTDLFIHTDCIQCAFLSHTVSLSLRPCFCFAFILPGYVYIWSVHDGMGAPWTDCMPPTPFVVVAHTYTFARAHTHTTAYNHQYTVTLVVTKCSSANPTEIDYRVCFHHRFRSIPIRQSDQIVLQAYCIIFQCASEINIYLCSEWVRCAILLSLFDYRKT